MSFAPPIFASKFRNFAGHASLLETALTCTLKNLNDILADFLDFFCSMQNYSMHNFHDFISFMHYIIQMLRLENI